MMIPGSIWSREEAGRFVRSGYHFQLYLPRGEKGWVPASLSEVRDSDADAAEQRFLWFAWPSSYGNSEEPCFFADQSGQVKKADNAKWKLSGTSKVPWPELALHPDFVPAG